MSVDSFIALEQTLRAWHGEGALYARAQHRGSFTFAAWAFLDGEPAILAEGLDILVLIFSDSTGTKTENFPRAPEAVFQILAPYLTRHSDPCPHITIKVPYQKRC